MNLLSPSLSLSCVVGLIMSPVTMHHSFLPMRKTFHLICPCDIICSIKYCTDGSNDMISLHSEKIRSSLVLATEYARTLTTSFV